LPTGELRTVRESADGVELRAAGLRCRRGGTSCRRSSLPTGYAPPTRLRRATYCAYRSELEPLSARTADEDVAFGPRLRMGRGRSASTSTSMRGEIPSLSLTDTLVSRRPLSFSRPVTVAQIRAHAHTVVAAEATPTMIAAIASKVNQPKRPEPSPPLRRVMIPPRSRYGLDGEHAQDAQEERTQESKREPVARPPHRQPDARAQRPRPGRVTIPLTWAFVPSRRPPISRAPVHNLTGHYS
jgi:hypothetical protein